MKAERWAELHAGGNYTKPICGHLRDVDWEPGQTQCVHYSAIAQSSALLWEPMRLEPPSLKPGAQLFPDLLAGFSGAGWCEGSGVSR